MILTVARNLIHNAIKFSENGRSVRIEAENGSGDDTSDKNFIQVFVIDSGIGISEEDQKKLFRIDVKTQAIGNSREKGTGLGLILCKEFVEKNGGKLWIESEPDKGSSFIFSIPASDKCTIE